MLYRKRLHEKASTEVLRICRADPWTQDQFGRSRLEHKQGFVTCKGKAVRSPH